MRNNNIVEDYKAGLSGEEIGIKYGISTRQVQRIAKSAGVIRTISESFNIAIERGRMKYHKTPEHLKVHRHSISHKLRYQVMTRAQFKCEKCNIDAKGGYRLEVDHIDSAPNNNVIDNLQLLCSRCNVGKYAARVRVVQ